jgi:ribosomal protein S18 acetylase RimI-like enzyme
MPTTTRNILSPLTRHDLDRCVEISAESFAEPWSRQAFVDILRCNNVMGYAIEQWAACPFDYAFVQAGYLILSAQPGDRVDILALAIAPEWRMQGIARQVVDLVKAHPEAASVQAFVSEYWLSAQWFFRRMGFVCTETREHAHELGSGLMRFVWEKGT